MAEEGLHFLCTEALNGFQRILHRASPTTLAMEAVDEAVRFVPRMHQHASGSVEDEGVVPFAKHGFLAFCQRSHLKAAPHLRFLQGAFDGVKVRLAAVEQQQVWPFVLALEPALHDLLHHAKIVHGVAFDRVGAVLLLGRSAVAEHDTRAHPFLTLQLRHVEADDVVQTVQAKQDGTVVCSTLL